MRTRTSAAGTSRTAILGLVALLLPLAALAAPPEEAAREAPMAVEEGEPAADEEDGPEWSGAAQVNIYVVPDTRTYAQPTLAADYGVLHLEARYNYEGFDTGSAWLGYNLGVGEELSLAFTPMVGGVFGRTMGVAPGYELTLAWWKLEFYSEGEYLFDTDDSENNFAYAWSELSLSPFEWLRFGGVAQRTRAYESDVEVQRGILVGAAYRWFSFTTYVFDLGQSEQTWVLGLGADF